jgi:hypothetical protein
MPAPSAVIPVVSNVGVVIVPAPEINVQLPVPIAGVFPAMVAKLAHNVWFGPALAVVGTASASIKTVDVDGAQTPLLIVHINTFGILVLVPNAVTPEFGNVGDAIVPAPDINVQLPVPMAGVFPASVAKLAHTDCDGPAFATVGGKFRVTETVDDDEGQTPLPMVHWNTFTPTPNDVKAEFGEFGELIIPEPDINVHVPVPIAGTFPFKVAVVAQTL